MIPLTSVARTVTVMTSAWPAAPSPLRIVGRLDAINVDVGRVAQAGRDAVGGLGAVDPGRGQGLGRRECVVGVGVDVEEGAPGVDEDRPDVVGREVAVRLPREGIDRAGADGRAGVEARGQHVFADPEHVARRAPDLDDVALPRPDVGQVHLERVAGVGLGRHVADDVAGPRR